MATLRETGPYIYPTWLPKLLAALDSCEWKIWFQVHHDGRSWDKLPRDCHSTKYNLQHTELMKRCAQAIRGTWLLHQPREPERVPGPHRRHHRLRPHGPGGHRRPGAGHH